MYIESEEKVLTIVKNLKKDCNMNNKQLAHDVCQEMISTRHYKSVWMSDNLGYLNASERKMILKVFKQYYKIVEYTQERQGRKGHQ